MIENKFLQYVQDQKDKKDLSGYMKWLCEVDALYEHVKYPSIRDFFEKNKRFPDITSLDFEEALIAFLRCTYRPSFRTFIESKFDKVYPGIDKEDFVWPTILQD